MTLPPPITSKTNAKVKALRAGFSGKASRPGELVAVEGETLLLEALRSGIRVESVFVRQGSEGALSRTELCGLSPARIVVLGAEVFASAVDTASPQGIAALIAIPEVAARGGAAQVTLVLEAMQDPGNLGTLLRTAEAFGVDHVLVTPDTVNPWNPKTMRASAGSVFRVPVTRMSLMDACHQVRADGGRLFAAVAQGDGAISCVDADLVRPCGLMIGNEGAGLSAAALACADARIHIPCATESLNAAAAGLVLMYEAMRQRMKASVSQ